MYAKLWNSYQDLRLANLNMKPRVKIRNYVLRKCSSRNLCNNNHFNPGGDNSSWKSKAQNKKFGNPKPVSINNEHKNRLISTKSMICITDAGVFENKREESVESGMSNHYVNLQTPIPHCWSDPSHFKRKYCHVCRKRLDDHVAFKCEGKSHKREPFIFHS